MSRSTAQRWWSRLGFGSVPGDPEESRAFLQKRVAFYLGLACLLWTVVTTMVILGTRIEPHIGQRVTTDPLFRGPPFIALFLALFWLYLRRGERPLWALNALDALGTLTQTWFMALITSHGIATYRPEMNVVQGMTFLVIARAAIVPSTATRTFVLSALAAAPLTLASYALHVHATDVSLPLSAVVMAVATWSALGTVLGTVISRVIYGLHRRVQEATRLGQYVLERKLGEGGMGVVYLAKHAMLRRPTAVKLLPPQRAGKAALARFEREVQLTSTLTHPNTIAIYDYGRTPDGLFYYAMEYLDGLDLERLVRKTGAFSPERTVHVLKQVAGALEEAHAAGLVHRDIKPSNILLSARGAQGDFAKVLDFGLVRQTEAPADAALSGVQVLTGTPLYMSPEAINDASSVDGRTDIYAVGAVAYYLLTGQRVFDGTSAVQVCGHHLFSPVVPPSARLGRELPAALEKLVLDCLEKDRDKRVPSATALLERLEACDVKSWTADDARRWWRENGDAVSREEPGPAGSSAQTTLNVDLQGRG